MAGAKTKYICNASSDGGAEICGIGYTLTEAYDKMCETADNLGDSKPGVEDCLFYEVARQIVNVNYESNIRIWEDK